MNYIYRDHNYYKLMIKHCLLKKIKIIKTITQDKHNNTSIYVETINNIKYYSQLF